MYFHEFVFCREENVRGGSWQPCSGFRRGARQGVMHNSSELIKIHLLNCLKKHCTELIEIHLLNCLKKHCEELIEILGLLETSPFEL